MNGVVVWCVFSFCALMIAEAGQVTAFPQSMIRKTESESNVGRVGLNRYLTPTGQVLSPEGMQVELPGMRPQSLALSPDAKLLAVSGKTHQLVLLHPATGQILQRINVFTNLFETTLTAITNSTAVPAKVSYVTAMKARPSVNASFYLSSLVFSPDGKWIYGATTSGNIKVYAVNKKNKVFSHATFAIPNADVPKQKHEIVTGLAVSQDGKRLYALGNLANRLFELDAVSGKLLRFWETGVAPCEVALANHKAYVCNLGGRRPGKNDLTAPAGRGTTVRVDPVRHIASEGSVSIIDLNTGAIKNELVVGLHASALTVSPDKRYVVVANTGSDTLNVIDTSTDQIIEKIWARQTPADLFGAQPTALVFNRSGNQLYVCNGTQNALAVVRFEPEEKASKVIGLIPVGWFPGAVQFNHRNDLIYVANIKGVGALKKFAPYQRAKLSTKDFYGAVSYIGIPSSKELEEMTQIALDNMHYPKLEEVFLPPRTGQPARPVPERTGEPSVFKHVVYVIKENRSYDQILGDMKEGNGDPNLCIFGEKYTPNQHKIAREFVLLDNTYCSGVQSADGHQWTDSAIANEYVEKQLILNFPRSYTSGKSEDGLDALAWASSGFIWDHVRAHGKTFINFGEWMMTEADWRVKTGRRSKPTYQDFWRDYQTKGNLTRLTCKPGIESLRHCSYTNTVGWDLNVPDVMRAAEFIKELKRYELEGGFPHFIMIFLPNDHTGGTRGKSPTPGAQVADNDLAFGQIVEALSHSKFWPETCIFAIEDDPQAGWDHVSGYRTTCYTASPYTKRGAVISTHYNQTSLMRTMELILGLPPMNQLDATATPMFDCFTDKPDFTPFVSVPNRVPLDQTNPEPKKIANRILRHDAIVSARLPLDEPDRCPEDVLNRILWRAMKGTETPYPEWAVAAVDDDD